jgi:hypothetical protein
MDLAMVSPLEMARKELALFHRGQLGTARVCENVEGSDLVSLDVQVRSSRAALQHVHHEGHLRILCTLIGKYVFHVRPYAYQNLVRTIFGTQSVCLPAFQQATM